MTVDLATRKRWQTMNPLKNFQVDPVRPRPPENFSRFDRIAFLPPNLPRRLCGTTARLVRHTGGFARPMPVPTLRPWSRSRAELARRAFCKRRKGTHNPFLEQPNTNGSHVPETDSCSELSCLRGWQWSAGTRLGAFAGAKHPRGRERCWKDCSNRRNPAGSMDHQL